MRYFIFLLMMAVITASKAATEYPVTDTEENPVWYYIQVMGEGTRANRVMTVVENMDVYGRTMLDTVDETVSATQLWQAVKKDNGYCFVNKATGQYLTVRYDAARSIGIASLSETDENIFRLERLSGERTGYFNLMSVKAPMGGNRDELYLHQANDGGQRDFVIMLVGGSYSGSENSAFRFVAYEDVNIRMSTDAMEYWYTLNSSGDLGPVCVTDRSEDNTSFYPFTLDAECDDAWTQQWKITGSADGKVCFTNRATQQVISTVSEACGMHNVVQSAVAMALSDGWNMTYLGGGQYAFSAMEEDGITRYLNVAKEGNMPDVCDENKLRDSGFAWKLKLVDTVPTGIKPLAVEHLNIRVEGRCIEVDNSGSYSIYAINGQRVNAGQVLAPGIYIVRSGRMTKKVLVR